MIFVYQNGEGDGPLVELPGTLLQPADLTLALLHEVAVTQPGHLHVQAHRTEF